MVKQQNMDFQFIYLKNISFSYPKEEKKLFENFNLSIKEKDFLSIIGPNGSGKTTIFKLIIKEYMPDEGLIYLKSKELKNWKRKEVAKFVSYLPQKIPLD
ncbi:MAG: ATP-binding cassette domain-containing protein, partial [Spirochaetota bacterium]